MNCRHCKKEIKDGDLVVPIVQWGSAGSACLNKDTKYICFDHVKGAIVR